MEKPALKPKITPIDWVKIQLLNARTKDELTQIKTTNPDEVLKLWNEVLTADEKEQITAIANGTYQEKEGEIQLLWLLNEISDYCKNKLHLKTKEGRIKFIQTYFATHLKEIKPFHELVNNPEYDQIWYKLLTEVRANQLNRVK